jgi:hypothetical protein
MVVYFQQCCAEECVQVFVFGLTVAELSFDVKLFVIWNATIFSTVYASSK